MQNLMWCTSPAIYKKTLNWDIPNLGSTVLSREVPRPVGNATCQDCQEQYQSRRSLELPEIFKMSKVVKAYMKSALRYLLLRFAATVYK